MDPLTKTRKKDDPEARIQKAIIKMLTLKDWLVMPTHGNLYQMGFPDLFTCHYEYGIRWIEVKNPKSFQFTAAQLKYFPALQSKRVGVWVLVAATEYEYAKLMKPANWHIFTDKTMANAYISMSPGALE